MLIRPHSFLKEYKGRLNHVSKLFVEARDGGKPFTECAQDDSQAHGIIKVSIHDSIYNVYTWMI